MPGSALLFSVPTCGSFLLRSRPCPFADGYPETMKMPEPTAHRNCPPLVPSPEGRGNRGRGEKVRGIFSADPRIVGTNSASPSLSTEVSKNELKTNPKSAADGYLKTMKMPEPTPRRNRPSSGPSPERRGKRRRRKR